MGFLFIGLKISMTTDFNGTILCIVSDAELTVMRVWKRKKEQLKT
jgi:hypothetical protein